MKLHKNSGWYKIYNIGINNEKSVPKTNRIKIL